MDIIVNRRKFLKMVSAGGCSAAAIGMLPRVLNSVAYGQAARDTLFVTINLAGGADTLAILQPNSAALQQIRPTLYRPFGVAANNHELGGTPGNPQAGLHPAMTQVGTTMWQAGEVAFVQKTGMGSMSGSHDEAENAYARGVADRREMTMSGWIQRLALNNFQTSFQVVDTTGGHEATSLGGSYKPLAVNGLQSFGFVDQVATLESGIRLGTAFALQQGFASSANPEVQDMVKNWGTVEGSLDQIKTALANRPTNYPANNQYADTLADLETAFRYFGTMVGYLRVGGFDTHGGQGPSLANNLGRLDAALAVFRANMLAANMWNRVVIMITSEFSRTIAENGNAGTDHGGATTKILIGGRVNGGLYNANPSEAEIGSTRNALSMGTNVLDIYSDIIADGFGINVAPIFPGFVRNSLGLIKKA